ncbi:class I SAM-dependent methyltransferase [Asticcacaulis sp. YBE204]|uniref:class I SAM-dependent methyltransferase n=1 Tax=Asticcacaulis sp. YBE204 TaxID=1282363 RepID=UPI0003C3D3B9|nr:class I SAM-dependent methyltransferase [Asticcacaulis sp. YBE204]ESQ80779.1 hypothetical protein AEYBE204_00220 [Asticcacaulis sp. YBE204]
MEVKSRSESSSPCLACGTTGMRTILDFGPQAAANLLCTSPSETVRRERLGLDYCPACGHAQQTVFYPPKDLFEHYLYASGTTRTLASYFDWLAQAIAQDAGIGSTVLDIASNDGSFLRALAKAGLTPTGVEPAANLVAIARQDGLEVMEGFWPQTGAGLRFDRIVGMNVLAHGPDPLAFLTGVQQALSPGGVALIQVSQADMFRNFEFDTLYHEHYSFFCPNSLTTLARRAGFSAFAFIKTNIHGGSILAVLGQSQTDVDRTAACLTQGEYYLETLAATERPADASADRFAQRANATCASIRALETLSREAGRTFVLVGAAAKAITVLQASGARFDRVIDEAPLKIGRYIPGTALQIESFDALISIDGPCTFLIGAWNFKTEIDDKIKQRRAAPDLSATYFPTLSIDFM